MKPRQGKFLWKLFLSHAVLLVAVVGTCVWLTLGALDRFYANELTSYLRARADYLRVQLQDRFDRAHAVELDQLAKAMSGAGHENVRITLVQRDGTVLADSEADPAHMELHADRAEIVQALREGWGESTRWSSTVSRDMKYVAVRMGTADDPRGVVRVSTPERGIVARAREAKSLLWKIAAIVLAAASVLALVLAWLWSGPIARITSTARSLSKGDLSARAEVGGNDEIALLARSLNRMRDNLARQLETIDRQRRTLENLLAQLHEGVVVVGPTGRIMLLNPASARLLDLPPAGPNSTGPTGSPVEAYIPHPVLRRMLTPPSLGSITDRAAAAILENRAAVQEDRLTLKQGNRTVTLLARASDIVLPENDEARESRRGVDDAAEKRVAVGRLLVLTDITELTRTLQVKTDFVANASHELRTPLSAIRGAVETLISAEPAANGESGRLLAMIDRHSGRLEAMLNDLLDLSKLESASARFEPVDLSLDELVEDVRERLAARIQNKGLNWETHLSAERPTVRVNRELLRLVLDNLADNAVKFTEPGGRIRVASRFANGAVAICVEDDGCGIPPEDHDRVFERFYQVERSRTGAHRGTGLGLAIVRHAVNAMKGAIELDSAPGEGTRITITIPQPAVVTR